jgi:hypothetical protein
MTGGQVKNTIKISFLNHGPDERFPLLVHIRFGHRIIRCALTECISRHARFSQEILMFTIVFYNDCSDFRECRLRSLDCVLCDTSESIP